MMLVAKPPCILGCKYLIIFIQKISLWTAPTITATDALKTPATVVAITDNGNKNPDSQKKSTLGKVKDNITVFNKINHTGMSDDTAELNATIEKIEEGEGVSLNFAHYTTLLIKVIKI